MFDLDQEAVVYDRALCPERFRNGRSWFIRTTPTYRILPENVVSEVTHELEDGHPNVALRVLDHLHVTGPATVEQKNAMGVCFLRMGDIHHAITLYRDLARTNGMALRHDLPVAVLTNYATALLMANNVIGCVGLLDEIGRDDHPAVQRLHAAINRWTSELTPLERIAWKLGLQPNHPVSVDFTPGDLT